MHHTATALKNEDYGFDFERACKSVSAYSRATGACCRIIDTKGRTVFEASPDPCVFCREGKQALKKPFSCPDVHLYGSYQAERFGGRYIFFCPAGLTHWISLITRGDQIAGALVGGPVMMVEPEEFMFDDILAEKTPAARKEDILAQIGRIPVIKPEKVNDLSELLYIVASQISGEGGKRLEEQAERNILQARISETVHEIKHRDAHGGRDANYPYEKERRLLTAISLGDKPTSQRILNEILGYIFFSSGNNLKIMKADIQELTVLLSRAAIEGGADAQEIFGLKYQYLSGIDNYKTVEELTFWLSKLLTRFTDCVFNLTGVRHKDIILKASDYIRRNYMKKLTLEEVADHVYLNPSYFSRIFKSETGSPFVTYVNSMRIEMSKKLLLDLSVPLIDVSNEVGFDEQCYFTRVFKKVTGMTPGMYRKTMGRQPAGPSGG